MVRLRQELAEAVECRKKEFAEAKHLEDEKRKALPSAIAAGFGGFAIAWILRFIAMPGDTPAGFVWGLGAVLGIVFFVSVIGNVKPVKRSSQQVAEQWDPQIEKLRQQLAANMAVLEEPFEATA